MKPALALFDFDGTITNKDTFLEFIKFYKGNLRFYSGMLLLSPWLVLFKLKIFENWKAKEMVLKYFFKGENQADFKLKSQIFAKDIIPTMIRPKALQQLKKHIENGDKVIIISASAENWISSWVEQFNIPLLATRLEIKNGLITGNLEGKNCYGAEKINRLKIFLNNETYDKIYAYGDSSGDRELLAFATDKFYRHF